jgi:fatty acid desaturase
MAAKPVRDWLARDAQRAIENTERNLKRMATDRTYAIRVSVLIVAGTLIAAVGGGFAAFGHWVPAVVLVVLAVLIATAGGTYLSKSKP